MHSHQIKGTISVVFDADINCTAATANALYSLGDTTKSYWLDYVKSDGTSPLDATGTACTGSETDTTMHAFMQANLKISIPNITSCDGITATDSLSAFNWKCGLRLTVLFLLYQLDCVETKDYLI